MISHPHRFIFIHINKCGGTSIERVLQKYKGQHHKGNHSLLNQYDAKLIKDYFTFIFVRNPWAKMVSQYHWNGPGATKTYNNGSPGPVYPKKVRGNSAREEISFEEYITVYFQEDYRLSAGQPATQLPWISDKEGNLLDIDFIGRVENMQEDFNYVCDKIGIPREKLAHKHKTHHRSKPYWEYYTDKSRAVVAEKFKKDTEFFGYEFGK